MIEERSIVLRDEIIKIISGPIPEVKERLERMIIRARTYGIYEAQYQDQTKGYLHISRHYITHARQNVLLAYVWMPRGRANYKD